jgi:hypothetical protein
MRTKNWLVPIERPFRAHISLVILTQGFTLDAERDANVCGALCVITLGFDGVAPSGLEPVLLT